MLSSMTVVEPPGKVWTTEAELQPLPEEGFAHEVVNVNSTDLLPGFRYPIAVLFKEWDWQE
jgi:hypothetical protein